MAEPTSAAASGAASDLVPTVVLTRGDQILRREYPSDKLSIGTSAEAQLQFQAAGLPAVHPLLVPSKKGIFVYLREGMGGTVSREGQKHNIAELIASGKLPAKDGLYALSLEKGTQAALVFGDHTLHIGFGPKQPSVAPRSQPASTAPRAAKGAKPRRVRHKLVLRPDLRFAEIPSVVISPRAFWSILSIVTLFYAGLLISFKYWVQFAPKQDAIVAAPPPRIAKLIIPEEKKPEPVPVEELPQEEVPTEEKPEEAKPAEAKPTEQKRAEAKQQVKKLGLVQVLGSSGGGVAANVQTVMDSLANVFSAGALTTNPNEGDAALKNLENLGGSGGIDDAIAGLKGVKSTKLQAQAEKVDSSVVQGEGANDVKRSREVIHNRVRQYMSGFKILYKKLIREHPTAQGTITFRFTIKADGTVGDVKVLSSAFKAYSQFEKDMADRIAKMQFDPIPKGDVTVEYPFLFTPSS
ncbi:MAG: TonB family protein [Bdellovibrionota bacterium]